MERVLIIAYHFPPCAGSSGLLRSEKFSRYLPDFGWEPVILVPHPRAYEAVDSNSSRRVEATVIRTFALDAKKHLSFRNSYSDWTALPDRWVAWIFGAIPAGLWAVRRHGIKAMFSTFPISTAILIGLVLHRLARIPWVVDLRDSMTEDDYPKDPRTRKVRRWIERQAMRHASCVIFTAASTKKMYLDRYPELTPEKCILIPNGYDEADFQSLCFSSPEDQVSKKQLRLLHTGLIYPEERDPMPFFRALSRLKREGRIGATSLKVVLRAAGSEGLFQKSIEDLGITDIVELLPHVPYQQALQECADSDGLLLFQAANCDHQIPAKAYEYLRLGKPIFALTSLTGDTAALLNEVGGATIVNLAKEEDIYRGLPHFLAALRSKTHALPQAKEIQRYSRKSQAKDLAHVLDHVTQAKSMPERQRTVSFAR